MCLLILVADSVCCCLEKGRLAAMHSSSRRYDSSSASGALGLVISRSDRTNKTEASFRRELRFGKKGHNSERRASHRCTAAAA